MLIDKKSIYVVEDKLGSTLRRTDLQKTPSVFYRYNRFTDQHEVNKNLILPKNLEIGLKNWTTEFVKEFWDTFREEGVTSPVYGYEFVIETGTHKPIRVKQPRYGMHEIPIMQKTIDELLRLKMIKLNVDSPYAFRITLAAKPHQEHINKIEDFVWRFCINYILLNQITRPASYPIPRCDDAVMYGFGSANFFILFDAYSGYHQIKLSPCSIEKTAFYAPQGRKYVYVVMPFGLRNCPTVFIAMMHDLKHSWDEQCEQQDIKPDEDNGTTIIMDDNITFAVTVESIQIIARCVCMIARKYTLTWKLKKCR